MNKRVMKLLATVILISSIEIFSVTVVCKRINYNSIFESGTFGIINNNSSFNYKLGLGCDIPAKTQKKNLATECNLENTNFKQLAFNNTIILDIQTAATAQPMPAIKMTFIDIPTAKEIIIENITPLKNSKITLDLGLLEASPFLVKLNPKKIQPPAILYNEATYNETVNFIKKNPVTAVLNNFGILQWYLDLTINRDQTVKIQAIRLKLNYMEGPEQNCKKHPFMYFLTGTELTNAGIIK